MGEIVADSYSHWATGGQFGGVANISVTLLTLAPGGIAPEM
ncbi:MAG: hypothetical protein V7742_20625 [Halioglobus sp.]